jgi:transposase-like protein
VALQVVSTKELKLEVLFEPERSGDTVTEVCRRRGISRETLTSTGGATWPRAWTGLEPRSRRPCRSPLQIEPELEATICRLRLSTRTAERAASAASLPAAASLLRPPPPSTRRLRRNHLPREPFRFAARSAALHVDDLAVATVSSG